MGCSEFVTTFTGMLPCEIVSEMSGRHHNKKKKHHEPHKDTKAPNHNPIETPSAEQPERIYEKHVTLRAPVNKPSDSTVAAWTLVTAVVVAVIYFQQLMVMRDSVDTSRKVSERDARALVNIRQNGTLQTITNQTLELPVRITNIGRTPAKRIVAAVYVEIVPQHQSPNFDEASVRPLYRSEVGDLFPNDRVDFNVMRMKVKGEVRKGGGTETWPLTEDEHNDLIAGRSYVAVHGRVAYDDVFHVRHWTQFCFWWPFASVDYHAGECTAHNTEDDKDEP
jgi:hypothetical protein